MSIIVPFANVLKPPLTNRESTGEIKSELSFVAPTVVISSALSPAGSLFLQGDVVNSTMVWTDRTEAANSHTINDVPLFNGNGDSYIISFSEGDDIESIDFYVSTAGVYTGTPVFSITYRNASNDLIQGNITAPDMSTEGIKRVMYPGGIQYDDLGFIDDPRSISRDRIKGVLVTVSGFASVTTAPVASMVWKRRYSASPQSVSNITDLITAVDKTPWLNTQLLPLEGTRSLFGFTSKTAVLLSEIERSRPSGWDTKLIYSAGDGLYADCPSENLTITSASTGDELMTEEAGSYIDTIIPPEDWRSESLGDSDPLYWFGWEYTSDAEQPELISLVTLSIVPFEGTGIACDENKTLTKVELFLTEGPTVNTTFLVINKRTQQVESFTALVSEKSSVFTTSIEVLVGDELLFQIISGDSSLGIYDGFIRIS